MSEQRKVYRVGELRQKPDMRPAIFTAVAALIIVAMIICRDSASSEVQRNIGCIPLQVLYHLGVLDPNAMSFEPNCFSQQELDAMRAAAARDTRASLPEPVAKPTEQSSFATAFANAVWQVRRLEETGLLDPKSPVNQRLGEACIQREC